MPLAAEQEEERFAMGNQETPEQHLLRSLRVTASSRFNAGRRLRRHEKLSLWAVSFFSLVLIIIPLFQPFGLPMSLNSATINLLSVMSAALILVASLIVSGSNFSERAEKMHRCGLELNALAREVHLLIQNSKTSEEKLREINTQYSIILSQYENHADIDFKLAKIDKAPDYYGIQWYHKVLVRLELAMSFSPYLIAMMAAFLFLLRLL